MNTLTQRSMTLILPLLVHMDGFICWYCKMPLFFFKYIFEHLNDNRKDNRIENLVLACQSCNNKKPHDPEMKQRAMEKLSQNESSNYLRERKFLIDELTKEPSAEIEINVANSSITKQFITEKIECDGFILLSEALYCSVYLCIEKTGHGSPQSVREYIKTLTCEVAPFEIIRDENRKKVIRKRQNKTNQDNVTDLQSSQSSNMNGGKENVN